MSRDVTTELPGGDEDAGYLVRSKRPLQVLLFLSPLIIAYELALAFVLGGGAAGTITVAAHRAVLDFLGSLGFPPAAVLYLGGALLALLLLVWHVLRRDPWRADLGTAGWMTVESIAWTIPLLAFATVMAGLAAAPPASLPAPAAMLAAFAGPSGTGGLEPILGGTGDAASAAPIVAPIAGPGPGMISGLAISIGAGLYEELFFRWVLIAVIHVLLVDVARLEDRLGSLIAVVLSAAAFTFYHDVGLPGGGLDLPRIGFLAGAGIYFGAIYAVRGFGVVVGVHAAYDIATVLLAGATPAAGPLGAL